MRLRTAALTDIGLHRRKNEDRFLCDDALRLYGVADGIGGLPGGAEAAQRTVDTLHSRIQALPVTAVPELIPLIHQANEEVIEIGHALSPHVGIGTTLTIGVIRNDVLQLAHVGDSRCYVCTEGSLEQLSRDHTVESDALWRRARGEVVHYYGANAGALTRCIGQLGAPEVDLLSRPLRGGERYLFCSDGISRLVSERELLAVLSKAESPEIALRALVDLAIAHGGPDNATGVAIFVDAE